MNDKFENVQNASASSGIGLNTLTGYLYSLMMVYAVSVTMIGPIMPLIIETYGLRLSQGGLIMTFQSIGGIMAIILSGMIADLVKKSRLIGGTYFIFGLSLVLIGFINSFSMLLAAFFLLGAAARVSDTVLNAYISDLHDNRRGTVLNLLHTFFGIGAFAGPLYVRVLLERGGSWQQAFSYLGLFCAALILLFPVFEGKSRNTSDHRRDLVSSNPAALLASPFLWILGLIMILYVGHQSGVVVWIPMYMETMLQVSPTLSGIALSLFWMGIIAGRLTCAHLTQRIPPIKLLIWGSLVGGALLTGGLLLKTPAHLILALGLTGLFTGATIPLLVAVACECFPNNSGTASSVIFFCGSISTLIFPWLIGALAEAFGFQWGILLTGLVLFLIFAMGTFLRSSKDDNAD